MRSLLPSGPPAGAPVPDSDVLSAVALSVLADDAPFLAYDLSVVERRVQAFRTAFRDRVAVRYAVKCNPDAQVLAAVSRAGGGFEVASLAEASLAVAAGARPEDLLFSNPVKPPAHVSGAAALGLRRFAVDSPEELAKVAEHAPGSSVYVRLSVDDTSSRFPLSAKFGCAAEDARRLLVAAPELGLVPDGLTFHVGSQCTDPDAWAHAVRLCAPLLTDLLAAGVRLRMLDLGGGFPARYAPGEVLPDLEDVAARVLEALGALPYVPEELFCEPGRAVVAEAAVLGATVIGRAERHGRVWVYTDVGAYNGLMEAAQTGGTLAFPVTTSRLDDAGPVVRCTVTGPSCDSSDTLLRDVGLPASLTVGDRLYLGTAGAYSVCYASSFNGFPPPRALYLG